MADSRSVAVLVGSLRRDSINRKVALSLIALAPPSLKPEIVEIGQLPIYNQDGDASPPAQWTDFRPDLPSMKLDTGLPKSGVQ